MAEGRPSISKRTRPFKWQPEEDEKLLKLVSDGATWKVIARATGRSEKAGGARYKLLLLKASRYSPKTAKIVELYHENKARMWEPIAREVGLPWYMVANIFWQCHKRKHNMEPAQSDRMN